MAKRELSSPEVLRQLLRYEPDTGRLFWRERGLKWFDCDDLDLKRIANAWNAQFANREALYCIDATNGYRRGSFCGSRVYAHRAIWAIQSGKWPEKDIDHINGVRTDNTWSNLRAVDRKTNSKNQRLRVTNTSGMMGVRFIGGTKGWRATVTVNGVSRHIGVYATFDDACDARRAAEVAYGFHANHGA